MGQEADHVHDSGHLVKNHVLFLMAFGPALA
jgi:hypothetical protein